MIKEQNGNKTMKVMILKASLIYTWGQDDCMVPQNKKQ